MLANAVKALGRKLGTNTRRIRTDESGAAAVEFAMVLWPFFFVLGCIIETGLMLFTEYVLQTGVQEGARIVRTGQAQSAATPMNAAEVKAIVCETAGIIIDCDNNVTVYLNADTNFAALHSNLDSMLKVGPSVDGSATVTSFQCGSPSQAVAFVATYDWRFSLPFMSMYSNIGNGEVRRLIGFAMFKNEPFPATTTCTGET